jgi:cholesterol oxidase
MADAHFDVVIIGSGFGGSVMAYRLADAGLRVCVLERGQAYPPGSFPRSPHRMKRNFWDPSAGLYGLFNVWSFRGLGAVVSSGLGGGSLIYANVLIRKDEKWFVQEDLQHGGYEHWPVTRADLEPHYDRVEAMLNAQRYPFEHAPYNRTPKTTAMRQAAAQLGLQWELPKLAVTFHNPGAPPGLGDPIHEAHPNLHQRPRTTCRLCGECDVGCNYGSKNTLDYNYLSAAHRLGAEIRTLCEVRTMAPAETGGGYVVHYVPHDLSQEGREHDTARLPLTTLRCDRLVLAAGAFGTPYLLLRNKRAFPQIGALGSRFSVNGDYLSFITNCRADGGGAPRLIDPSYGPVITSAIRVADALDTGASSGERGFYVEDGGYPEFVNWMLETAQLPGMARRALRLGTRYLSGLFGWNRDTDLGAELAEFLGPTRMSMSSFPLLAMGRDVPNGTMRLEGTHLAVDWVRDASAAYFDRLRHTVRSMAAALHGEYADNVSWYLGQVLTAHPLGGCPMGRNDTEGVVNSTGAVFNYPGLVIADGSVMPGPVGPNPALTIAALADRFADGIIAKSKKGL